MLGMFFRTVDFPPQGILVSDRSSLRCINVIFSYVFVYLSPAFFLLVIVFVLMTIFL